MITKDSKKVLVADDSIFFRTKVGDILSEAGHAVSFARSGTDAVKCIADASGSFDLLCLDLEMEDLDGFQVLEWMGRNGFADRFPVLVITAIYQPGNVIERLKGLGASELITKDFSPQQLVLEANKLLFREKAVARERSRRRVPVSIPADFTMNGEAGAGFILNISTSGAYLNTGSRLKKGERLVLRFSLPGSAGALSLECVVRWTTCDITEETRFCGGGVMFASITPGEREAIARYIEEEGRRLEQYDIKAKEPSGD